LGWAGVECAAVFTNSLCVAVQKAEGGRNPPGRGNSSGDLRKGPAGELNRGREPSTSRPDERRAAPKSHAEPPVR
jgi:hypothetical protein